MGLPTLQVQSERGYPYISLYGYGSVPIIINLSGMNIYKSQLFWGSLGIRVLTHPHIDPYMAMPHMDILSPPIYRIFIPTASKSRQTSIHR